MTEKEMIEAMAEFIIKTRNILKNILLAGSRPVKNTSRKDCYFCLMNLQKLYKSNNSISDKDFLNMLFETKIPEGSVVLTKNEYEELNITGKYFNEALKQTRKETAKEILEKFISELIQRRLITKNEDLYYEILELKDELFKQYGVEVEE